MNRPILRRRILGALRLQPMTYAELARCLSSTPASIAESLRSLRQRRKVKPGNPLHRSNGRPESRWELVA